MYTNKDLSEKELLRDLMMSEKQLSNSYNDVITKSSCPILRKLLVESLNDVQNIQYSIYDALDSRGYNKIKLVNDRELKSILDLYNSLI